MKVGDIKIEAIKLMFANYAFDMQIKDLQTQISDENYGSYIVNLNGSISRALDRIENACVVPVQTKTLTDDDFTTTKFFKKFDTSTIEDLFVIDRVTAEYANGYYDGNVDFELQGDTLMLKNIDAEYTILYYPTIKTIDDTISDTDDIWIPERIARLIPYFVKGDLFQEDEPELAADARNLFEASLDDLKQQNQSRQSFVSKTYKM